MVRALDGERSIAGNVNDSSSLLRSRTPSQPCWFHDNGGTRGGIARSDPSETERAASRSDGLLPPSTLQKTSEPQMTAENLDVADSYFHLQYQRNHVNQRFRQGRNAMINDEEIISTLESILADQAVFISKLESIKTARIYLEDAQALEMEIGPAMESLIEIIPVVAESNLGPEVIGDRLKRAVNNFSTIMEIMTRAIKRTDE